MRAQELTWLPISTAPRNCTLVLVNDTNDGYPPWVAAIYIKDDAWSGWAYDDDVLQDSNPAGPKPTHWLPVPPLPEV